MNTTQLVDISEAEQKLSARVDPEITRRLEVSGSVGGIGFQNADQVMQFAKLMALSHIAVPKHLRGNPGACLAVTVQAVEWGMSPYAVANKSYSVNDRLAYESQLIQAVILKRAPIKGRFRYSFSGTGASRRCKVEVTTSDDEVVEYETPEIKDIPVKNSPLWKGDPDQQLTYYAGRALCRRHFPDVLLGVNDRDEIDAEPRDPSRARDVTPTPRTLSDKLDALAAPANDAGPGDIQHESEVMPDADDGRPAPRSQDATDATPPRQPEAQAAAGGADGPPTTPEGYVLMATAYIAEADDADWLETRWREERKLRTKIGVSVDDTNALAASVQARAEKLRGG